MSVENLSLLSVISLVLAGVFFVTAVILFFLLRIKKVISELSGFAQKTAVKKLKNKQLDNAAKNTKELPVPMKTSGNILGKRSLNQTDKLSDQGQTTVLQSVGETTVLNGAMADVQGFHPAQSVTVQSQVSFTVSEDITICEGEPISIR